MGLVCPEIARHEDAVIDVWLERSDGAECNCEVLYDLERDEHVDFRTGGDA